MTERKALVPDRPRPRPHLAEDGAPPLPDKGPPPADAVSAGTKPAREIWRLFEYLMEHGAGAEGLWQGDWSVEVDEAVLQVIDVSHSLIANYSASELIALSGN
jgi:hypothetical protein